MRTAEHKSPFQLWIQGMLTTTDQEAAQGIICAMKFLMKWVWLALQTIQVLQ